MPGEDVTSRVEHDSTRAALLLRLARQVTGRHDLDDVLAEVFRCLRPLVHFGGGSIQLLDDDGWIRMASSDPIAPDHVMAQRIPLGTSVAGRVILTEQPVYLADIEANEAPRTDGPGRRVSTGVRSYFGVPLVADGRAIGVLQVDSPSPNAWAEDERAVFIAAAPIVAAAIQNSRAHVRAAVARVRVDEMSRRMAEARMLIAAARSAVRRGDRTDLERQLKRIDAMLTEEPEPAAVPLPQQRATETAPLPATTTT